ncbi:MAG: glutathione synthase [Acidocella sp.]|nr:glutathione synthase [Acidocella sp.]
MAGLKIAVQMNPMDSIDITGDSSFALMLEAQARGHSLWHYQVGDMWLANAVLQARVRPVRVTDDPAAFFEFGPQATIDLQEMDVILMRQDPPFDMAYITATHLLEHIHPKTLVVNNPAAVRNAPEKLLVTHFPALMPPTLIARDPAIIRAFRATHNDIIVKPLFGNGGIGVFRIKPGDENLGSLLDMFLGASREPLMIQRYEPAVRQGDKRIILIDGEPLGALNRIPAEGDSRSNMHAGGVPAPTTLTPRELEICAAIGPVLKAQGLLFTGIDVIGDYLTEINVTSPTGLRQIARFDGVNLAAIIWQKIEATRNAG